jgi:hypothetical protein
MIQPGEICLMMDATKGVSYRLAEPRAAKPVIDSKHQLRGMPADLQLKVGRCRLGGNSIYLCLTGVLL